MPASKFGFRHVGRSLPIAAQRKTVQVRNAPKASADTDLPVQQPIRMETVLNFKTAKALGLTIPASIISLADEVIKQSATAEKL